MNGTITDIDPPLSTQFNYEQTYQGFFRFDSDAVETDPGALDGYYYGNVVTDLHFSVGDYVATAGPGFNTEGHHGPERNGIEVHDDQDYVQAGADNIRCLLALFDRKESVIQVSTLNIAAPSGAVFLFQINDGRAPLKSTMCRTHKSRVYMRVQERPFSN